jgi:YD repeat-containing protein
LTRALDLFPNPLNAGLHHYHTPDDAKARAVEAALTLNRPGTECYFAPRSNIAGAYWLPRLADEITASDVVLFLAGTRIGPWQELEYYEALRLSRGATGRPRLVPIVMAPQAPGLPFFAQLHQIFAAEPAAPEHLSAIVRALEENIPAGENRWQHFQPYKGLPALQEADAAFFFGRESETAEVLNLLARRPDRIITLVGQSGVGKSSLARAGIVARLKSQIWPLSEGAWPASLSNSRAFLPLVVRPNDQPLKELALAFAQLYSRTPAEINEEADSWVRQFAGGTRLRDMLRSARDMIGEALGAEPPNRFVLYVDQGEELYSARNSDTAALFSNLLAEAAEHETFSVLLSLRSDYYTPYQNDRDLFLASERIDVLALESEVLTEIVRKPAETLGARFESADMAGRVVEATWREPGALPLLSDLMHDMWLTMQARGDGMLRWSDNPEIVDVAAPLRTRAEAFLAEHADDEAVVRRLFTLRLSQVRKTGEPVRRRARRSECDPAEWRVAETLAEERWRLLSLAGAVTNEPVLEVAHEQLLRRWPRLTGWLEEEREFLMWRGQVEEAVEEAGDELLTRRRLAMARLWFERRGNDLAPKIRQYIAASIIADDRRVRTLRWAFRLQFLAVGAILGLVGLAVWEWTEAEFQRHNAEFQAKEAAKQSSAARSATAQLLAIEAIVNPHATTAATTDDSDSQPLSITAVVRKVTSTGFIERNYRDGLVTSVLLKSDGEFKHWEFAYDDQSRVAHAEDSEHHEVALRYDEHGLISVITNQDKQSLRLEYNANLKLTSIELEGVGAIRTTYTETGEIKHVESDAGRNVALAVTSFFQQVIDLLRPAGLKMGF